MHLKQHLRPQISRSQGLVDADHRDLDEIGG
jgi:hypothetical protein